MDPPTSNDPEFTAANGNDGNAPSSAAGRMGRHAAAAIDQKRENVADRIDSAASALRDQADRMPGGEKLSGAAQSAAGALESASAYIRDQDVNAMLSDLAQTVKKHPGAALLTAAAVGFLLARSLTRN